MARFSMRPYRDHDTDAAPVLRFLSEISRHPRYTFDYHPGDFVWQGYRGMQPPYSETMSIWERAPGEIVAIGWSAPPGEFTPTIDPALRGTPDGDDLTRQMISWAEDRQATISDGATKPIDLTVGSNDADTQRVLAERGYRFSGVVPYSANVRTLDEPTALPGLAAGYRFKPMTDDADLAERVAIHRDVWAPSTFSLAGYQRLREAPLYRQDMDLVVQAPDGRFASYLIAWWDAAAQTGLLEPVGARAEYRRQGLTKALILETLRRLQTLGATRVYVNSVTNDEPSNALYRSAGFARILEWQRWARG
jgi:GNAT superfamily N-acetyltransferase